MTALARPVEEWFGVSGDWGVRIGGRIGRAATNDHWSSESRCGSESFMPLATSSISRKAIYSAPYVTLFSI